MAVHKDKTMAKIERRAIDKVLILVGVIPTIAKDLLSAQGQSGTRP